MAENTGRQKYLAETTLPHIGAMVQREMERQNLTPTQLGRMLGVKSNAVTNYFKSRSMQAGLVLALSRALNYDFFTEVLDGLPADFPRKKDGENLNKIAELETEIADLKKENALLKELFKK